eukprot:702530-Pyramimonas_sp.AAC.1
MEEGCIQDVADMLDEGPAWDILLYQEGPRAEHPTEKVLGSGHLWFSSKEASTKRSVGVLLHKRWVQQGAET